MKTSLNATLSARDRLVEDRSPGSRHARHRGSRAVAGLLAAVLLVLTACHREAKNAAKPKGPEPVSVTLASVTNAFWERSVPIVGTLFPKDEATLGAQVEGAVERTLVEFGDRLKTNQVLAYIDTASYLAQAQQTEGLLAKAEAAAQAARRNFDRVTNLSKASIASESDMDQARSGIEQAEAEVKAARGSLAVARLNLERSEVKAPFDSAVARRIVGRGDFVRVGSPLFEVVNDSVLKFIFQVPERFASMVTKRLPVSFTVDNYPGETFTGNVYLISPSVTGASRAFSVGALVTNVDFRLKASTYARGTLVLEKAVPTPSIPLEAIINFAGVTKVFVADGTTVRGRAVRVGRIREGIQEVLEGLREGEKVVVTGHTRLFDGSPVIVQTASATARNGRAQQPDVGGKP